MTNKWSLDDVYRYFRVDPEISAGMSHAEFDLVNNPDTTFCNLVRAALEYQGFDPKVVLRQMIRNRAAYEASNPILMEWDLSNTGDDFSVTANTQAADRFTNRESLARDVLFMVLMFLTRNNHISKIVKKAYKGLSEVMDMLKEKYAINDDTRQSGTQLGSSDVTLPRITGVFPATAVRLFSEGLVKEIVPAHSIPGYAPTINRAVCCPFLPSLHPKSFATGNNIHGIMLYVAIKLDDIIHKKKGDITDLDSLITYYKAGYESSATPDSARKEVFRKLGFITINSSNFVPDLISCNAACLSSLATMRVSDPKHSDLINLATSGLF